MSHPTRVRGLKQQGAGEPGHQAAVAPHAGAWIETGLPDAEIIQRMGSHPTRVRGLKPMTLGAIICMSSRRTPRGCVD